MQREAETDNLPRWQTFAGLEHAIAGGMVHNRPTLNHLLLELFGLEMKVIVYTQSQWHQRHHLHLHLLHCHLLDGTDPPYKMHKGSYRIKQKISPKKVFKLHKNNMKVCCKMRQNLKLTDTIHAKEISCNLLRRVTEQTTYQNERSNKKVARNNICGVAAYKGPTTDIF